MCVCIVVQIASCQMVTIATATVQHGKSGESRQPAELKSPRETEKNGRIYIIKETRSLMRVCWREERVSCSTHVNSGPLQQQHVLYFHQLPVLVALMYQK